MPMLKLYKTERGRRRYWEAWDEGSRLLVHQGLLGTTGRKRKVVRRKGESARAGIERLAAEVRQAGYAPIAIEDHATVEVEYRLATWGNADDLGVAERVEFQLNECLGWSGNGHCD